MKTGRRNALKVIARIGAFALYPWVGAGAEPPPAFEAPQTRQVTDLLPSAMIRGAHYEIGSIVKTFDYLDQFTVKSDYGDFSAPSDAMLRRLLREIAAITELRKIKQGDAFAKAAVEAAKSPFRAVGSLIEDPVGTVSAVPEGIASIFSRVGEQIGRGGRSQYEDGDAKALLNVSSYKREYAQKLSVDPYSSNPVLQKELNSVAWAAAAGNMSLGALSMATGAAALEVASDVRLLEQAKNIVIATPPAELSKRNRVALARMGLSERSADAFLDNRLLSPRHQTVIVTAMTSLGALPGTTDFITYAAGADTENAALVFQQMAELIAGYHAVVAKLRKIDFSLGLPAAITGNATIMLLPLDRLLWTRRAGIVSAQLANASSPELWLTGTVSPQTGKALSQAKIAVRENVGKQIRLLD